MKRTWISGIHINGFGHFADFELRDFGPGVTVIHGANEAGKSTLLAYIRAALFGLKTGSKAEVYLPARGGAHGGHIFLNDDLGLTYDVLRSKGTHGGTLAVSVSDGRHMDDGKPLIAELLGHTTGPLFDSVFAFGLGELEDLKKLDSGEVSARIYGAGMGAKELPSLLTSIDKAADALFKKRGQQPAVTLTLAELRTAQSRLAEVETQAGEYADLRRRQDALRRELDGFGQGLDQVRKERAKDAQLLRGLGDVVKLQAVESALAETPKFEGFPNDAVARWIKTI